MKKYTVKQRSAFLVEMWKKGKGSFKVSELEEVGFDIKKKIIEIGNFRLKKRILGNYNFSIIDNDRDLDNNLISENKKAFKYFQTLLKKKISIIKCDEILDFNLNDRAEIIQIGNIELISVMKPSVGMIMINSDEYKIQISNDSKNSDGKWKDSSVNYQNVIKILQKFKVKNNSKITELKINSLLVDHFRKYFENAHKSKGGPDSLYDLIIGDYDFVIELKMAKAIKSTAGRQKASGQIKQYFKENSDNNLMLVVIGNDEDKQDRNIKYLENEVIEDYNCFYHFIEFEN